MRSLGVHRQSILDVEEDDLYEVHPSATPESQKRSMRKLAETHGLNVSSPGRDSFGFFSGSGSSGLGLPGSFNGRDSGGSLRDSGSLNNSGSGAGQRDSNQVRLHPSKNQASQEARSPSRAESWASDTDSGSDDNPDILVGGGAADVDEMAVMMGQASDAQHHRAVEVGCATPN